jgi:predicted nucleic acid-binding protein
MVQAVSLLADTSVWSPALRRDAAANEPEALVLAGARARADLAVTTGLVLQELLQSFSGPRSASAIVERFRTRALAQANRENHVDAAALKSGCRRAGVQLGTVDDLIAQLCIRNRLTLLTADQDFTHAARHCNLAVWPSLPTARRS